MADTVSAIDLIPVLEKGLTADVANLTKWDNYLEGEQPLKYMSEAMKDELGETAVELVLNWARLVADACENRLDVEGFRYADSDVEDEALWAGWQYNDMDEQSQQGHLESLALGRSYVLINKNEEADKPPRNTVESPFQVWAQRDPKTRKVSAAIKKWKDLDEVEHILVYTPVETVEFIKDAGAWKPGKFKDKHNFGIVPVVPLVNKPRLLRPDGVTEFKDIIPLADAANKMATDMMTSAEFHAMPRRWAFGLKASDFVDRNGNPVSSWSKIKGRLWASEDSNVKVGTFPEADLANFHNTIKLLAQLTSQIAALPPHYMGFGGNNVPSADAIRSSESQLVKRIERKHTFLGGAWEDVQRINLMFMRGKPELEDRDHQLETVWRDPSTPTVAQVADAAVKKYESGLVPLEQTRIDLGYSATQREQMREMDTKASPASQIAGIVKADAA